MTTIENTAARTMSPSLRRILGWLHLWIGLIFCIPFAILGVTGSILVYDEPLADFVSSPPHASAQGEMKSVQEIVDAAAAARGGATPLFLTMPTEAGDAAIIRFSTGEGRGRNSIVQTYVDPVSLQVLDTRSFARNYWIGLAHDLHGNMMWNGRQGRQLVGWFGVGMLLLGISGLIMWWPRNTWRGSFGVKKGARGWLFHRQLHATCGVASWVLFIILSFSGVAISFPQTTGAFLRTTFGLTESPLPGQAAKVEPVPGATPINTDQAVAIALKAVPGARLASVFFPAREDQPLRVNLLGAGMSAGVPAITVNIDQYKGETISVRDPWNGDVADSVLAWQRPLHFGRGTSELYKLAIFIVGLLPPLFAFTGVAMWWTKRRTRAMAKVSRQQQTATVAGVPAE